MMIRRWSEMAKIMSPVWRPVLITLVALTLSRLAHSIWLSSRVSEAQAWTHVFVQGLRFDAVLLGLVWVIPAALTPWMALNQRLFHRWAQALRVYALAWFVAIMFMEMATPSFMHQYDARPNYMLCTGGRDDAGQRLLAPTAGCRHHAAAARLGALAHDTRACA
jgi:hypothetical protein